MTKNGAGSHSVIYPFQNNYLKRQAISKILANGTQLAANHLESGRAESHGQRRSRMIGAMDASISGVKAFQKKIEVSGNNIANVNTDTFKRQEALLSEGAHGGVRVTIDQVDEPGYPKETVADGEVVETESSNVDLVDELTGLVPSQTGYDANLKTIRASDEMLGALLDILG
jgi:flagellar basal body rod protein FlgG